MALLYFSNIPTLEPLLQLIFEWFVDGYVHWLQLVSTICWHLNSDEVVLLKQGQNIQCCLTTKAVEYCKGRLGYWQIQALPLSRDKWHYYLLDVSLHCLFIGPVIVAMPNVPSFWSIYLWVTPNGFPFVDHLRWKILTCHCSCEDSCDLALVIGS